jgi:hypothetical protein
MTRDSAMRALRTFIISFLALFIPALLGWLNDLLNWANGDEGQPFPSYDTLAKAAISAVAAALIALVNWLWNATEDNIGKGMLRQVPARTKKV